MQSHKRRLALACLILSCIAVGPSQAFDVKGSVAFVDSSKDVRKGRLPGDIGTFEQSEGRDSNLSVTFDVVHGESRVVGKIGAFSQTNTYRRVEKVREQSCEGGGTSTHTNTIVRASTVSSGPNLRSLLELERVGDRTGSGVVRVFLVIEGRGAPATMQETSQKTAIVECDIPAPDEPTKKRNVSFVPDISQRRILLAELKPPFGRTRSITINRALTAAELGTGPAIRSGSVNAVLTFSDLPQARAMATPQDVVRAEAAEFDPTGSTGKISEATWSVQPAEECARSLEIPGAGANPVDEIGQELLVFKDDRLVKTRATLLCGIRTALTVADEVFWDTAKVDLTVRARANWATQMRPDKTHQQMGVANASDLFRDDLTTGTNFPSDCFSGGRLKRGCEGRVYLRLVPGSEPAKPGTVYEMALVPVVGGEAGNELVESTKAQVRAELEAQMKRPGITPEEKQALQKALDMLDAANDDGTAGAGEGFDFKTVGEAGPFGGHFYVLKPKLEIERVPTVNPTWLPGGLNYRRNIEQGVSPQTLARFAACARKHEVLHSEYMRLSLRTKGFKASGGKPYDPAPDIELIFDHDPQRFVQRVSAAIREAAGRLSETMVDGADTDSHKFIRGRLMADPQCNQGAEVIFGGIRVRFRDFASIGTR